MIQATLVDLRNWASVKDTILNQIREADTLGFDIETEDSEAHEQLKKYRNKKRLVFDHRRATLCGFSMYAPHFGTAYYFNAGHADVANRIPWDELVQLFDAIPSDCIVLAHNAPFEIGMMRSIKGIVLPNMVCTLQMAVTHHNPDQYDLRRLGGKGRRALMPLFKDVLKEFAHWNGDQRTLTVRQSELVGKFVGKSSDAAFSYNGIVKDAAYGYGLKKIVESFFGFKMTTFEQCLGKKEHMGQLTGEETVSYGADDAYWCYQLYEELLNRMIQTDPDLVDVFFDQENPMIYVYADIWYSGFRVNKKNIDKRLTTERTLYAETLRELKSALKKCLPFDSDPSEEMMNEQAWYKTGFERYRKLVVSFANAPDGSDYVVASQTRGPVSNTWRAENGDIESSGINLSHYMPIRTIIHDLLGIPLAKVKGEVKSDKDVRKIIKERMEKDTAERDVMAALDKIAAIEQRVKLFLVPYAHLTDPETNRMYPVVSSKLATRRMASSFPNPMQLAKRGASAYVRGFYLPDSEDELLVSLDWSQVELVIIGEESGDPEFAKAFGQIPYNDLHTRAAADCLELTVEALKARDDYKDLRTKVGKGANFNYWYSGSLSTVGENLNWSSERMWEATEKYRQTFAVAEEWRVNLINEGRRNGFVKLPDGTRRVRLELTPEWIAVVSSWFTGIEKYGSLCMKRIQTRAGNQLVNAVVQGTSATLAKRSIIRIRAACEELGIRAKFKMPVHDEVVFSVHKDDVVAFIRLAKKIMTDHPDIISNLKLHCTASVGKTFQPWDKENAPDGQVELDEIQGGFPLFEKDHVCGEEDIQQVVEYFYTNA